MAHTQSTIGFLLARIHQSISFIEESKVGDNHRNGQRQCQHTSDRTQTSNQLPNESLRNDISIPYCCHGDKTVPERMWNTHECVARISFCIIQRTGEDNDTETQEEHEHAQLPHADLESVAKNLETHRVSGEFEDAEHSHQADDTEN